MDTVAPTPDTGSRSNLGVSAASLGDCYWGEHELNDYSGCDDGDDNDQCRIAGGENIINAAEVAGSYEFDFG